MLLPFALKLNLRHQQVPRTLMIDDPCREQIIACEMYDDYIASLNLKIFFANYFSKFCWSVDKRLDRSLSLCSLRNEQFAYETT